MIGELWNKLDPGFFAPIWLFVGFLAVIAVVLLEIGAYRRRNHSLRLFAATHLVAALTRSVSPVKRLLKRALLISTVGLLFVAMARPHLFYDWIEENHSGLDILLAVDCSKSMLSEDVKPNRLERAKLAVADFAEHLPDNRLGLIAFAGDSFLQCPLTLDHEAFDASVRELDTDTIPRPGTDIATAIEQAVLALRSQSDNVKILILVTDGEDLEGHVLDAAKAAGQAGLKIYTVGVGTPAGSLIPERDNSGAIMYHHNASGEIVQSKLDESTLRQIADTTGGAYVPLGQRGEGLQEIYDRYIAPLPKHNFEERREKLRIERFEWPLSLAILFLMWEFIINERAGTATVAPANPARRTGRRPSVKKSRPDNGVALARLIAFLLLPATLGTAQASTTDTAERDYKSGKYQEALQNYRDATTTLPNRNDLQYNRGDAAYKAGEFSEAEEAFRKTLETTDLPLQENAYYNLGNTQFKHGEAVQKVDTKKTIGLWEQALNSYDSALKLKPTADAQHNYDVVKRKLEELKKQQQDKNNQQQKQDQNGRDSKQKQDKGQQGQQGQQPNQNGQNGQGPPQDGKSGQDKQPGSPDQDKNGQEQSSSSEKKGDEQKSYYSQGREQDKQDPGVKSRQEAQDLLDSLKDDEHHVTARSLNENNEPPPPPPSGKDW